MGSATKFLLLSLTVIIVSSYIFASVSIDNKYHDDVEKVGLDKRLAEYEKINNELKQRVKELDSLNNDLTEQITVLSTDKNNKVVEVKLALAEAEERQKILEEQKRMEEQKMLLEQQQKAVIIKRSKMRTRAS